MKRRFIVFCAVLALLTGCTDPREEFGKTYYLDGAGNWGFGVSDVPAGLASAGYAGHVELFMWTTSFVPAIDQVNILGNKLRSGGLSRKIRDYARRHPEQEVNLIALSAGTGIAVWAIENLPEDARIDNLVLLGSSLSHNYDMSKALQHIKGKVYVYHSEHDEILTSAVRILGTVDGKHEDSAGLVGLHPPKGDDGKIVNIAWSQEFAKYGWTGAHTDSTNRRFIQHVVAPRIFTQKTITGGPTENQPPNDQEGTTSASILTVGNAEE